MATTDSPATDSPATAAQLAEAASHGTKVNDVDIQQLEEEERTIDAAISKHEESLLRLREDRERIRECLAGARALTASTRSLKETSLESQTEVPWRSNADILDYEYNFGMEGNQDD